MQLSYINRVEQRDGLGWRLLLLTLVIVGINFIGSLTNSTIQIALPQLANEMGVRYETLSVLISIYWLSAGVFALPAGKLGDIYSPKMMFVVGMSMFTGATLMCALTDSYWLLIGSRSMQAVGLSATAVNGVALLRGIYPREQINRAMGYWSAASSLGYVLGPSLGGFLVDMIGWRTTFSVCAGFVAIYIVIAVILLPKFEVEKGRFDYIGAGLLGVMITTVLLALTPIEGMGAYISPLNLLLIGLVTGVMFWQHEKRTETPLVDLSIFSNNRSFQMSLLAGAAYAASMQGLVFLLQYYMQDLQGYSAAESGVFWMLMSISNLVTCLFVGRLSEMAGPRKLAVTGTMVRVLSFAVLAGLALVGVHQNYSGVIIGMILIVFGFGMGITAAPIHSLVLDSFESNGVGSVAGAYNTLRYVSNSAGIAIFSQSMLLSPVVTGRSDMASAVAMSFGLALLIALLSALFLVAGGMRRFVVHWLLVAKERCLFCGRVILAR
ncbi:MAG TPA: MFS transporter [Anaerolineae bacterium]|nr:MFS transporter [Anaerolineae bacterium]